MEASQSSNIDLILLGVSGLPLKIILDNIASTDAIRLASTNTQVRKYCLMESKFLKQIEKTKKFDFNILPTTITHQDISALHRVFPNLIKITTNLANIPNHFLDHIRDFEHLQKLCIYLNNGGVNFNRQETIIPAITIKGQLHGSKDTLYNIL